ncbi:hypothetical protein Micbo1qcDRAFT_207595 [Microdochium bolleyi]|uniref:Rhodopsin domain-containing protein n=1 Tax=Microdochium bolleyi TaxID=196109 RepID=A0A136ISA0_9PEZI|nr:hypothetical protein Micbo1qcDRAFT_207595 [Microdochium bolleyi]
MSSSPYIMEPPPGQVRNLDNPQDIGHQVVAAGLATTFIALAVLSMRIFTRAWVVRSIGLDDYFAIAAMLMSVGFSVHLGAGRHMWHMLVAEYSPSFLAGNIGITITYSTSVSFSKLSILVFYLRLSPKENFRRTVYVIIGIVIAYTVAYVLTIIFQCTPVSAAWDITIRGNCIKPILPMMTLSTANILIDVIILLIPIKVFLELHMSKRQRSSLIALFGAGGFVCAVAIQRTIILPSLLNSTDYTWDVVPQMIWGFLEVNVGVVCAALPALKPLFTRYLPRFLSSHSHRSGPDGSASATTPYSTSIDRNRRRRNGAFSGAGEQAPNHLDEQQPRGLAVKLGDDEEQLWSPSGKSANARHIDGKQGGDNISLDSLEEERYGLKQSSRTVISAAVLAQDRGTSDRPVSLPQQGGIVVTRETKIQGN